jgi:WD40 repeat protein
VGLWDPTTGVERLTLTGHTGEVRALAFAADTTWLASAATDQTVRVWNLPDGRPRCAIRVDSPLDALATTRCGLVAAGGHGAFCLRLVSGNAAEPTPL